MTSCGTPYLSRINLNNIIIIGISNCNYMYGKNIKAQYILYGWRGRPRATTQHLYQTMHIFYGKALSLLCDQYNLCLEVLARLIISIRYQRKGAERRMPEGLMAPYIHRARLLLFVCVQFSEYAINRKGLIYTHLHKVPNFFFCHSVWCFIKFPRKQGLEAYIYIERERGIKWN